LLEVDADEVCPVVEDEEIGVGDGGLAAEQVAVLHTPGEQAQPPFDLLAGLGLLGLVGAGREKRL